MIQAGVNSCFYSSTFPHYFIIYSLRKTLYYRGEKGNKTCFHQAHSHLNTGFTCKTCQIHSAISQVSELILSMSAHELGRADFASLSSSDEENTHTHHWQHCCLRCSIVLVGQPSFSILLFCHLAMFAFATPLLKLWAIFCSLLFL